MPVYDPTATAPADPTGAPDPGAGVPDMGGAPLPSGPLPAGMGTPPAMTGPASAMGAMGGMGGPGAPPNLGIPGSPLNDPKRLLSMILPLLGGLAARGSGGMQSAGALMEGMLRGYLTSQDAKWKRMMFEGQADQANMEREGLRMRVLSDLNKRIAELADDPTQQIIEYNQALDYLSKSKLFQDSPNLVRAGLTPPRADAQSRAQQKAAVRLVDQIRKNNPDALKNPENVITNITDPVLKRALGAKAAAGQLLALAGDQVLTPEGKTPEPKEKKSFQSKAILLDGKAVEASFDPQTGDHYYNGQRVDPSRVRPIPPASMQINTAQQGDIKDIAQQLIDGDMAPSQLSKRSASYNATLAAANRLSLQQTGKPFNVKKAELDYLSAQKFVASMNGAQPTRFRALAGSVINTIDEVRNLADELQQGSVQLWNKATRNTIIKVYGNTPQSDVAVRYVAALNTLKSEFANLENGGFAPTEDVWKLANRQINEDYGAKDTNASLIEIQRLLKYRVGAFENLTPYVPGGGNFIAPPPSGGPANEEVWVRDRNGRLIKKGVR